MTVEELIRELQNFNPNYQVCFEVKEQEFKTVSDAKDAQDKRVDHPNWGWIILSTCNK